MRPGSETRHSDQSDALTGVNMFTDVNENARKVHVHCFVAIGVRDANKISGAAGHACENDVTIADGLNGRSGRRAIINSQMRPICFQNWMETRLAEMRRMIGSGEF